MPRLSTCMPRLFTCCCTLAVLTLSASHIFAGEVRYLSNAGSDSADGKTPATAWRTIEKLNASLPAGATALLRRGDVFYGGVRLPAGRDAAHRTTLTAYGEGPKPVITATKIIKPDPSVWEDCTHCFWRVAITNEATHTGLKGGDPDPGFLIVDGEMKPWKRFDPSDLVMPWDFCGRDGYIYVHATNNPALLAKEIAIAVNEHAVSFNSHFAASNLFIRATGAHGMAGGWSGRTIREDIRISDCDFADIGGSECYNCWRGFHIRYGNGVEFGSNCRDAIVERCTFRGVYDTATTMQGVPSLTGWDDIHFRDCTMTDCTQAFEIWCRGAPKGKGFKRCSFTGNRTLRVGGGWGPLVRPKREVSTPLLVYSMDTDTVDIDISGNTFEVMPYGLIYCKDGPDKLPAGYRVHDNVCKEMK